jgi:type IV pilus assembly protein PilB
MNGLSQDKIKETLVSLGLLDEARWLSVLNEMETRKIDLETALTDLEVVTDDNYGRVVADLLGFPYVHLSSVGVPEAARALIPESVARAQMLMPFEITKTTLKVAMHEPGNHAARHVLEKKTGLKVAPFFATKRDLEAAFGLYRRDIKEAFAELIDKNIASAGASYRAEDLPIAHIVDTTLEYAYESGASDVHIEPQRDKTVVRYRVDGVLKDMTVLPKRVHELVVARVKILAKLKTDEHRSAQDGKFNYKRGDLRSDIRVSVAPVIEGEKIVMRLLSEKTRRYALEELGLRGTDLEKVKEAINKPWGMILSTGPTGCGKTTTLYAILKILNERAVNIATIEDPVEYELPGVSQIQVNTETNLTFAEGLKSILRQDPDIIMVGEIRDAETGGLAVNAAMTGHLVLSTVHTNDAATAITRMIEMRVEPFLISSTINVIVAQRLVRRICRNCLTSYEMPLGSLEGKLPENLLARLFAKKKTVTLYRGKGCMVCHFTGTVGRIGLFEVLEVTDAIKRHVISRSSADDIRAAAIKEGMTTMFEDGIEKVLTGETTIEEVEKETRA